MSKPMFAASLDLGDLWSKVREELKKRGIDFETDGACAGGAGGGRVKIVCVAPDLKESVKEMAKSLRDQVLMVRVDEETSVKLDAWVETGAVKSRSEAAALFMREGLKLRAGELERLKEHLREVEEARKRLHAEARKVFGGDDAGAKPA